jgi:hypothetical protein
MNAGERAMPGSIDFLPSFSFFSFLQPCVHAWQPTKNIPSSKRQ